MAVNVEKYKDVVRNKSRKAWTAEVRRKDGTKEGQGDDVELTKTVLSKDEHDVRNKVDVNPLRVFSFFFFFLLHMHACMRARARVCVCVCVCVCARARARARVCVYVCVCVCACVYVCACVHVRTCRL